MMIYFNDLIVSDVQAQFPQLSEFEAQAVLDAWAVDYQHRKTLFLQRFSPESVQRYPHKPPRHIGSLIADYVDHIEAQLLKRFHPDDYADELDALWFNLQIQNPPDEQRRLRSLPYPFYLQTEHWKRVRAAMLLIYRATCQSGLCDHDGFWTQERYLHVHHLTYANRGNERYADLQLLCDICHKRVHEGTES